MELKFKQWFEDIVGHSIVAQNQTQRANPLIKGAANLGMDFITSGGKSFRDSLGRNYDNSNDNAHIVNQIIRDFNVDNNFLQFSVLVPMEQDFSQNQEIAVEKAKQEAIQKASASKIAQHYATYYKANLKYPEVVRVDIDQKNQQVKIRLRFKINMRTSDKLNHSYSYKNVTT